MKRRTFYIVILVCCMSFFSAANEKNASCPVNSCCKESVKTILEKAEASVVPEDSHVSFSTIDFLGLSI